MLAHFSLSIDGNDVSRSLPCLQRICTSDLLLVVHLYGRYAASSVRARAASQVLLRSEVTDEVPSGEGTIGRANAAQTARWTLLEFMTMATRHRLAGP